jgi:hypothetical protein
MPTCEFRSEDDTVLGKKEMHTLPDEDDEVELGGVVYRVDALPGDTSTDPVVVYVREHAAQPKRGRA